MINYFIAEGEKLLRNVFPLNGLVIESFSAVS